MNFYYIFLKLCNSIGKSPSKVAVEIGSTRAAVNRWKNGSIPSDTTLLKLADYFGVSIEYLKGETENPSTESGKGEDLIVYTMGDNNPVEIVNLNRDALADLTELSEVAKKLSHEKIKALLNIAKLM